MQSRALVPRLPRRQAGMSLVELLVALTLGAFITVGIIQMFTANQRTYQVNMGQARLQEGARFAMEFLAGPLRMAGYQGCFSDATSIRNNLEPDSSTGEPPFEFDLSESITGMNSTGPGTWSPGLDQLPGVDSDDVRDGTDVLVVRSVNSNGVQLSGPQNWNSAQSFVTEPPEEDEALFTCKDIGGGQKDCPVLMISDCEKATVFQINNSGSAGNKFLLVHNEGNTAASPGNFRKELTDGSGFAPDASVYAVSTRIFYVGPIEDAADPTGFRTNNRGERVFSLWRKVGSGDPAELVEGIADLQLSYGFDTDGDGVPNRYRAAVTGQDSSRIVTVRVTIQATSIDSVTEEGDGILDRSFSKTIALRNRFAAGGG